MNKISYYHKKPTRKETGLYWGFCFAFVGVFSFGWMIVMQDEGKYQDPAFTIFFLFLIIFGLFSIFGQVFWLYYFRRVTLTIDGLVSIPEHSTKVKPGFYLNYNIFGLRCRFYVNNIKNMNLISDMDSFLLLKNNQRERELVASSFEVNLDKMLCIEFIEPLKYSYGIRLPIVDKIYVTIDNPEKLRDDIIRYKDR